MEMDLYELNNTYLAPRKYWGTIGGHYSLIHSLNSYILEIGRNGQTKQINVDHIHDVMTPKDTHFGAHMHVNGPN